MFVPINNILQLKNVEVKMFVKQDWFIYDRTPSTILTDYCKDLYDQL
jgi:hypothetical protein